VKRILSAGLLVALIAVLGVTTSSVSAQAVAAPSTIAVDCTSSSTLSASTVPTGFVDVNRVLTAQYGDIFTISNTSATGSCVVAMSAGAAIRQDSTSGATANETITSGATADFAVVNSGPFTITPSGGAAVTFNVDACGDIPNGSGIAADPWRVETQAHFREIGVVKTTGTKSACSRSGHYLQTANLDLDSYANDRVDVSFSGVFDGDHYLITLGGSTSAGWAYDGATAGVYAARGGLFSGIAGEVKKVRLAGEIKSSSSAVGSLADLLTSGGVVSEVESTVSLKLSNENVEAGGLVGLQNSDNSSRSRIQYSKFQGSIELNIADENLPTAAPNIGGLVGGAQGAGANALIEIRDSYARSIVSYSSYSSGEVTSVIDIGGLVGRVGSQGNVNFIRNYATTLTTDRPSAHPGVAHVGGVAGSYTDTPILTFVSNFWLDPSPRRNAIGRLVSGSQPLDYTASPNLLPLAVGVSGANLSTLTTFTSRESAENSGLPGGTEILVEDVTVTTSPETVNDYRWAITTERSTFVPSSYNVAAPPGSLVDQRLYTNRVLYQTPEDNPQLYQTKRAGSLSNTAHGGLDPLSTNTYTTLGNVWEICGTNNDGYPTLVWEENTCGFGGDSGNVRGAGERNPGGLSDAEYSEFLASGLTIAEFLARRLAATGPPEVAIGLGGLIAALFGLLGGTLVLIARQQAAGRSR